MRSVLPGTADKLLARMYLRVAFMLSNRIMRNLEVSHRLLLSVRMQLEVKVA
jgi:hypothetical protein